MVLKHILVILLGFCYQTVHKLLVSHFKFVVICVGGCVGYLTSTNDMD